ncbi:hypothetical protein BHE74_00052315 [Ensete ventricosum]|nr:hypothetical protein BHE74_00052315 [Ensete ventricosum]
MKVSDPGPRGRLQRPQAIRNWAVVSNVRKSLKLRRWTILGGISNVAALCRSRCWNPWLRRMPSRESAAAEATARLATESSVMLVVRRMGGCSPLPRSIPTSPLSRFPSAIPFLPRGAETGERKAFARLKRATEAEMGCFVALYRMVRMPYLAGTVRRDQHKNPHQSDNPSRASARADFELPVLGPSCTRGPNLVVLTP